MSDVQVAIRGVCCSCQSVHPVYTNTKIPEAEKDDVFGPYGAGEAGNYLMAKHRTLGDTGPWCDGEGTVPAAVLTD